MSQSTVLDQNEKDLPCLPGDECATTDDLKNNADKAQLMKLVPLAEKALTHLGSLGSVAYYTMLNGLFCINLYVLVSTYRMLLR